MNYQDKLEEMHSMMENMTRAMGTLHARMDALEAGKPREAMPAADGLVPRGKYRGKEHAWVVANDPDHVQWVAGNGLAEGLGYTQKHIAEACAATTPKVR